MRYKTEVEKAWALKNDPEYFASQMLKVPAWGMKDVRGIVPLNYTHLQRRVMQEILWQTEHRKEVDLIIVKPRKMRCTTVLNAWEYQRITFEEGITVLNIAHSAPVVEEIFDRHIKTFHKFMPQWLRREDKSDNKRELSFEDNLSKIRVGVAGSNATRGIAATIVHLTESGWYSASQVQDVQQAVFPAVERGPGTARIDESTSAGSGTWQHRRALAAKDGESQSRLLFIGCYEVPEYRIVPPEGWQPDPEEKVIQKEFSLDLEQIYWRHVLLKDQFDNQEILFNQEYPATFDLAFQASGDKFVDAIKLLKAKKSLIEADENEPVVLGIDPAGKGDRTVIVVRQGRKIHKHYIYRSMDSVTLAQIVCRLMDEWEAQNAFIDMGYGHGTYDQLRALGRFGVIGVYFGGGADSNHIYANKRTEMAFKFKQWIEEGDGGLVSVPDDREFLEDISSVPSEKVQLGTGKLILPPKQEIKEVLGKSPDIFDATILTFAFPVRSARLVYPGANYDSERKLFLTTDKVFQGFGGNETVSSKRDATRILDRPWFWKGKDSAIDGKLD